MRNKQGMVLVLVLISLVAVTAMGLAISSYLTYRNKSLSLDIDRMKALYLAEAGIAHGKYELEQGLDGSIGPVSVGGGTYQVVFDYGMNVLNSKGIVNGSKRRLQAVAVLHNENPDPVQGKDYYWLNNSNFINGFYFWRESKGKGKIGGVQQ